jgi:hypothetical protein
MAYISSVWALQDSPAKRDYGLSFQPSAKMSECNWENEYMQGPNAV